MRTILIILFLGLSYTVTFAQKANNKPAKHGGYYIDNRQVTQKEFDKFLKPLTEVEGTWFCAETTTGGITGYKVKDKKGAIYEYETISDTGDNTCTITKEPILK